jgi:small-conductance mechanosensitive channel
MDNSFYSAWRDFFGAEYVQSFVSSTWFRIALILTIILFVQALLHRFIDRLVERAVRSHKHTSRLEEHKREATLKTFFRTTSSVVVWIIGAILVLWQLELDFAPLLTSAGLIGVIAGIGGQNVIKDCLAGLFIIIENQLRVDDIVTIATPTATVSGQVEEVTVRTTRLRDLDGNLHILTNGTIGVITNMSYSFAQVNIDINISYDTDIDLVERLIKEAGLATANDKTFKENILEPIVLLRVDKLGDSTVTLKALGKVKPGSQWDVAGDFRRQLKGLFDKHKISAPYPNIIVRDTKK